MTIKKGFTALAVNPFFVFNEKSEPVKILYMDT